LDDLKPAPLADAKLGEAADPARLARHLFDLGPLASPQHV
jgi:hypothetical protein